MSSELPLPPSLLPSPLTAPSHSAYASLQAPTKHTPFSDLYRRQVADTTYSDDAFVLRIIDSVTDECLPVCRTFADRVELCITRGGSDLDMARCSCDGPSLARMGGLIPVVRGGGEADIPFARRDVRELHRERPDGQE